MDRFDKIEFDDAVKTYVPDAFQGRIMNGATAGLDKNGVMRNALGLESTEDHRHVAKVWQKQCIPFTQFMMDVSADAANKKDILASQDELRLESPMQLRNGIQLTKNGMNSLRGFTDIPQSMLAYLDENGYEADSVYYINQDMDRQSAKWKENHDNDKLFRLRLRKDKETGNEVCRAIVSERYGVIDNHNALFLIANALPDLSSVLASHVDEDGDDMFGNLLLPDRMQSRDDSDYGVGIAFRNSEIRNSTFSVRPFVFRAICLNGCIWGRSNSDINVNQRHLGQINYPELQEEVRRAIKASLTQGNKMLDLMDASKQVPVANPLRVIAQLTRDSKMTVEQGRSWHRGYIESLRESTGHHNDKTAFGIVNGLTRSAQRYSGAMREQMESTAGTILAPSIDADLQEIARRWGRIADNAATLDEQTVRQYQYVVR